MHLIKLFNKCLQCFSRTHDINVSSTDMKAFVEVVYPVVMQVIRDSAV